MEDNGNQEPKKLEFDNVVIEQVNLNQNEVDVSKKDEIQINQETKSFIQNQSQIKIIQEKEDLSSIKQVGLPQTQLDPIQPIKDQQNLNQMNSQLKLYEAIIKISKDSYINKQSMKLIQTLINKAQITLTLKQNSIKPKIQLEMPILLNDLKSLGVNATSETKKEYKQKHRVQIISRRNPSADLQSVGNLLRHNEGSSVIRIFESGASYFIIRIAKTKNISFIILQLQTIGFKNNKFGKCQKKQQNFQ